MTESNKQNPSADTEKSCSKRIYEANYTSLLFRQINIETWIRLLHCSFFINQIEIFVVHASKSYWSKTFTCVHWKRFLHENWKYLRNHRVGFRLRSVNVCFRGVGFCVIFPLLTPPKWIWIYENIRLVRAQSWVRAEPSETCVFWIFMLVFVVHFKIITSKHGKHVYWFWISSWMGFGLENLNENRFLSLHANVQWRLSTPHIEYMLCSLAF